MAIQHHTIIIVGSLGKSPDMRFSPEGKPVTTLSVATKESWTGADGNRQEITHWWRAEAWGKTAENCAQYLETGQEVYIEATMKVDPKTGGPRIWKTQDGTPRASLEVKVKEIRFGSRPNGGAGKSKGKPQGGSTQSDDTSELPGNDPQGWGDDDEEIPL